MGSSSGSLRSDSISHGINASGNSISNSINYGSDIYNCSGFSKENICDCGAFCFRVKKMYLRNVNFMNSFKKEFAQSKLNEKGLEMEPVHSLVYFDYKCSKCKVTGKITMEYGDGGKCIRGGSFNSFHHTNFDTETKIRTLNGAEVHGIFESLTEFTEESFNKYTNNCQHFAKKLYQKCLEREMENLVESESD